MIQKPMKIIKTIALVGVLGIGMVEGEGVNTNSISSNPKIVEMQLQVITSPKYTDIGDKSLQDVLLQSHQGILFNVVLRDEPKELLLKKLNAQPNVDIISRPILKAYSGQSVTTSNVLVCKIPDSAETRIGMTATATPTIENDSTITLQMKLDWNRYYGYCSKNEEGLWAFHAKALGNTVTIPSTRPSKPVIRHSSLELQKVTTHSGETLVADLPVPDEIKQIAGDQTTILLVTTHLKYDDSKYRSELSDKLTKAIASKDKSTFESCFGYDALAPSVKKGVKDLEEKVFAWDKAYIEIVDPLVFGQLNPKISQSGNTLLTTDKGSKELKGSYLFDVHICKVKPPQHGFMYMFGGGLNNGHPQILTEFLAPEALK